MLPSAVDKNGSTVEVTLVHPDADALRTLASVILARHGQAGHRRRSVDERCRLVHDQLAWGWDQGPGIIGQGPHTLAAKTDKVDRRSCTSWPDDLHCPRGRRTLGPRPAASRSSYHLVPHQVALKKTVHATLHGLRPSGAGVDLSRGGQELLERMAIAGPWSTTPDVTSSMINEVEQEIEV